MRDGVKIYEGRDVAPGAAELIVGKRIADRFEGFGIGQQVKLEQREFTVVGHFSAGGSGFESEVWGQNAVFMPVLREDFQSVTFRMKDPARFAAIKKELEADPRLGVAGQARERVLHRPRRAARGDDAHPRRLHRADHGGGRAVRRDEHDVRVDRRALARDRDDAHARLQHGLDPDSPSSSSRS